MPHMTHQSSLFHRRTRVISLLGLITLLGGGLLVLPMARLVHAAPSITLVNPGGYYLALGDSLAAGYQPNVDWRNPVALLKKLDIVHGIDARGGYVDDLYHALKLHHLVRGLLDIGCPGETSSTMIAGECPFIAQLPLPPDLASSLTQPSDFNQLTLAEAYLRLHRGKVSLVTLDIGSNDVLPAVNPSTCAVNMDGFNASLATLDTNVTQTILPTVMDALTVDGQITGNIVLMNYYDPYTNLCPNADAFVQTINQHLAQDVSGYGGLVDVYSAFGGASGSNNGGNTWMESAYHDFHPTDNGYSLIAHTFEDAINEQG